MSDQGEQPVVEEVTQLVDAIKAAVARLEELDDPASQAEGAGLLLSSWSDEQPALRKLRQNAVRQMRANKVTYRDIAKRLKISVARVQQIEAGETGRKGRTSAAKPDPPASE
ncbi:hypothetical protein [Streptomyces sp. TE5632]